MGVRAGRIDGIDLVPVPGRGVGVPVLHAYLRESILDGRLPAGATLSQVALAEQLGVSRTPLREVLRRLEQEGLVEIQPNHRTRVARLDPEEIDVHEGLRILGETLALSTSIASFTRDQHLRGRELLDRMRHARSADDAEAWFEAHTEFHELIVRGAPEALRTHLRLSADRMLRERRDRWAGMPAALHEQIEREHAEILEAVWLGQDSLAVERLARHLAGSARRSRAAQAPHLPATAVSHAQRLASPTRGDADGVAAGASTSATSFDAAGVQSIYVQRIALESLGARMTAEASSHDAVERMADALDRMRDFSSGSPTSHWQAAHREFHLAASSALGEDLLPRVDALIGRSRHFMLMHGPENTDAWAAASALHDAVFDAVDRADGPRAAAAIANDLARPSLSLIAYFAPGFDARVLRAALAQFESDG